jgi:predicted PurR-regulated permease PerM
MLAVDPRLLCPPQQRGKRVMGHPFTPRPEDWPYLRRLGWTIVIAALLIVVWRAGDLLILAFGSMLGAVVFRSAARMLRRIGVRPQSLALLLGIVLVLVLFGVTFWLFAVEFGQQISQLLTNLPQALGQVEQSLERSAVGQALVAAVHAAAGGSTFAQLLGRLSLGTGEVAVNFIIVLVGAIFFATGPKVYLRGALLLIPRAGRPEIAHSVIAVARALRLWLRAQLICMLTMGLLVAGALGAVGLESWAALGLLAGVSEFVPYVGPTLAMLPALAIAAQQGGDEVLWVALAYIAVRLVQSNFITPVVTRRVVSIPPALTLFVILGTGAVFGVYGLFFSAALLVVAFVGIRDLYLRATLGESLDSVNDRR